MEVGHPGPGWFNLIELYPIDPDSDLDLELELDPTELIDDRVYRSRVRVAFYRDQVVFTWIPLILYQILSPDPLELLLCVRIRIL